MQIDRSQKSSRACKHHYKFAKNSDAISTGQSDELPQVTKTNRFETATETLSEATTTTINIPSICNIQIIR